MITLIRFIRLIRLIKLDFQWRGRLHSYMWMDGIGWVDGVVIIDRRKSKSTFGANDYQEDKCRIGIVTWSGLYLKNQIDGMQRS